VCKFDLILTVLFLAAFNVLTTINAYHLPLYQSVAIAFRILVLSVRFIVVSNIDCCSQFGGGEIMRLTDPT